MRMRHAVLVLSIVAALAVVLVGCQGTVTQSPTAETTPAPAEATPGTADSTVGEADGTTLSPEPTPVIDIDTDGSRSLVYWVREPDGDSTISDTNANNQLYYAFFGPTTDFLIVEGGQNPSTHQVDGVKVDVKDKSNKTKGSFIGHRLPNSDLTKPGTLNWICLDASGDPIVLSSTSNKTIPECMRGTYTKPFKGKKGGQAHNNGDKVRIDH